MKTNTVNIGAQRPAMKSAKRSALGPSKNVGPETAASRSQKVLSVETEHKLDPRVVLHPLSVEQLSSIKGSDMSDVEPDRDSQIQAKVSRNKPGNKKLYRGSQTATANKQSRKRSSGSISSNETVVDEGTAVDPQVADGNGNASFINFLHKPDGKKLKTNTKEKRHLGDNRASANVDAKSGDMAKKMKTTTGNADAVKNGNLDKQLSLLKNMNGLPEDTAEKTTSTKSKPTYRQKNEAATADKPEANDANKSEQKMNSEVSSSTKSVSAELCSKTMQDHTEVISSLPSSAAGGMDKAQVSNALGSAGRPLEPNGTLSQPLSGDVQRAIRGRGRGRALIRGQYGNVGDRLPWASQGNGGMWPSVRGAVGAGVGAMGGRRRATPAMLARRGERGMPVRSRGRGRPPLSVGAMPSRSADKPYPYATFMNDPTCHKSSVSSLPKAGQSANYQETSFGKATMDTLSTQLHQLADAARKFAESLLTMSTWLKKETDAGDCNTAAAAATSGIGAHHSPAAANSALQKPTHQVSAHEL